MKVIQLENKNQFVIENNKKIVFQSYDSTVLTYNKETTKLKLGRDWDYSRTTLKHLYIFIDEYLPYNENTKEICNIVNNNYCRNKKAAIQKMIDNKVIKYDNNLI